LLVLAGASLLLASCAPTLPVVRPDPSAQAPLAARYHACREYLNALNETARSARVHDAQASALEDFPYLRNDRFLASFATADLQAAAFESWVDRMSGLARTAWRVELANLPESRKRTLRGQVPSWLSEREMPAAAIDCGRLLRAIDLEHTGNRATLRARATRVPSEYQNWKRVAGLYYLTVWPVTLGVDRWQTRTRKVFATPLHELETGGQLVRFGPPAEPPPLQRAEVREILERSSQNPLGIADPDREQRARLFASFAPRWEIDVVTDADRIGTVHWPREETRAGVDTARPTVYRHLSHTRLDNRVLLQLNYTVWFPARPVSSAFDLLGGHLDGITWRVTLAPDGAPLLYDTIHNCGCYHLFVPTSAVHTISQSKSLQEDTFVVQEAPREDPLTLRVAHTSHYLQRAYVAAPADPSVRTFHWADYDDLRTMPLPQGGSRSLFRDDGIVAGTQRGERWVLWPMGVPEPGAMRQWGHHATAFVGRRHFDDPFLFEGHFEQRQTAASLETSTTHSTRASPR
jgi:hypothetical protein